MPPPTTATGRTARRGAGAPGGAGMPYGPRSRPGRHRPAAARHEAHRASGPGRCAGCRLPARHGADLHVDEAARVQPVANVCTSRSGSTLRHR